nr:LEAF RUST 10 DISEASE-RESISTANCE LOCUS RECEPTOR-LIKE PROTEIN KINASE-like 1.1 [Ipomoea batatas]
MGLPSTPCFFFFLFPLMLFLYFAHGEDEFFPSNCTKPFFCGTSMGYLELEFPFAPHTHPHCGLIVVDCDAKRLPNIQLETGGDWYQLVNVSNDLVSSTIFLEDLKLQGLLESGNYSNFTYTLQFHNSQSITFSNLEANPFLECNHNPADDSGNYDICIEGFSFSLKYKRKLVPENPKCDSVNCTLYPSPILVQQTNSLLTPHFGLHLKVSPTCYGCYHGGGICRADSNNEFECGIDKLPSNCTEKFLCGSMGYLEFPFAPHTHPHCGLILVDCDAEQFPTLQLETGGDSYQLQHVKPLPVWGEYVIFLGDVKLQRLLNLKYPNYSNLNYTLQFPYSPSITFHNLEPKQLSPTFLKCNYSEAYDDMGNYEMYNCTQEFNFTLNYKHPSSPQNSNCTLYPTPIVVKRTNTVLTAQFGLEFQVSPACYDCYYIQGGQCTTDSKNKFHCKKGKSKKRLILITGASSDDAFRNPIRYSKWKNPILVLDFGREMGMEDGSLGKRRRYNGTVIHTVAKIGAHLEDIDARDRKAIENRGNKIGGAA